MSKRTKENMSIKTSGHLIDLLPQARPHIWAYIVFHRIANEGTRSLRVGMRATLPGCLWIPALPTFLALWWYSFTKKAPASPREKTHPRFLLHVSKWSGSLVVKSRPYNWHICFSVDTVGDSPESQEARTCEKPLAMQHDTKKDIILHTKFKKELTKEPQS